MEWFEILDYDENPFSTDPREFHNTLINMEDLIEEMFYRINSGSMLVIEGSEGTGKTSLLMMAANKFGGRRKVVYLDCEILDNKLNITKVLQERYGLMGRLLNKKPRNMIVLLDNVNQLSKKNTERLKYYFDQNYIKSIIFTTENLNKAKFSESLKDRIGKRFVKTPKLSDYDAIDLVYSRIDDHEMFNETLIKKIFKSSGYSPKLLLQNCEKAAINAVNKDRKRVQMADLKVIK